jgi:multisubunit Na+/H+ antiporter MnhG subunit
MGIGLGIFLLVVGAILAFAVDYTIQGVDVTTIGYILLAGGVLSLLVGIVLHTQRTNTTHREVVDRHEDRDVRHRGDDLR